MLQNKESSFNPLQIELNLLKQEKQKNEEELKTEERSKSVNINPFEIMKREKEIKYIHNNLLCDLEDFHLIKEQNKKDDNNDNSILNTNNNININKDFNSIEEGATSNLTLEDLLKFN